MAPGPERAELTKEQAASLLADWSKQASSFQAHFKLSYSGQAAAVPPASGWISIKMPDRLRADILDPFGRVALIFIMTPGKCRALDTNNAVLYEAEDSRELFMGLFRMDVGMPENLGLLFGMTGFDPGTDDLVLADKAPPLDFAPNDSKRRLLIADVYQAGMIKCVIPGKEPSQSFVFDYDNVQIVGGIPIPFRVKWAEGGAGRLEIKYRDVALNTELDDILFTLEIPENVNVVHLP